MPSLSVEYEGLPDIRVEAELWSQLYYLRQNELMSESRFLWFLKERGVPASGVIDGEPGDFVKRGWLDCDQYRDDGSPLFHPFRFFPVLRLLDRFDLRIAKIASLNPEGYIRVATWALKHVPSEEECRKLATEWNRVVDLATLLEPIYWPRIVSQERGSPYLSAEEVTRLRRTFRKRCIAVFRNLDPALWRRVHECLLFDAHRLDENSRLYVLLRVGDWSSRSNLKGKLSGAMWLRHMAEVVRRGFEEAFNQSWSEEYDLSNGWYTGAKERVFGSERPLDDAMRTKPFMARDFGLFTGSSVRWYVEGDTEYYAFLEVLQEPGIYGIELINLRGEIAIAKGALP